MISIAIVPSIAILFSRYLSWKEFLDIAQHYAGKQIKVIHRICVGSDEVADDVTTRASLRNPHQLKDAVNNDRWMPALRCSEVNCSRSCRSSSSMLASNLWLPRRSHLQ